MSSKVLLLLFGLVLILAASAAEGKDEESSVSEQLEETRVAREADPGRRKMKNKKKGRKNKAKGNRRNKKRGKKNKDKGRKKVSRKNKRNKRKGKKNQKRKSGKGKKKQRKGGKKIKKSNKQQRSDPSEAQCAQTNVRALYQRMVNFDRQFKQCENFKKIANNKNKKACDEKIFKKSADSISLTTDRGDKCLTNTSAEAIREIIFNLDEGCNNVNQSCNTTTFPPVNETIVLICHGDNSLGQQFVDKAEQCFQDCRADSSECSCWCDKDLLDLSEATKVCGEFGPSQQACKAAYKECKASFGYARKNETASISETTKCLVSSEELAQKAAVLSANKDALTDLMCPCPWIPPCCIIGKRQRSQMIRRRSVRAVDATSCSEAFSNVDSVLAEVAKDPASIKVLEYANAAKAYDGECTAAETAAYDEKKSAIESALETVTTSLANVEAQLKDQGLLCPSGCSNPFPLCLIVCNFVEEESCPQGCPYSPPLCFLCPAIETTTTSTPSTPTTSGEKPITLETTTSRSRLRRRQYLH